MADYGNLSTKSHILKHVVEIHPEEEELMNIQFGIKIIKNAKTSFKRQIIESVDIQENIHHHLRRENKKDRNMVHMPRRENMTSENSSRDRNWPKTPSQRQSQRKRKMKLTTYFMERRKQWKW